MCKKLIAQMYSVRKEFELDAENTIMKLKEIGFDSVQLDGMRGNDPKVVSELLKKYKVDVVGMHIKHDRFKNDLDGIIEEALLFDCKLIYDKYIEDEEQNEEGYRNTKEYLINAVKILSPLGFRIGIHNPEYDFNNRIDGKRVMDYICEPTNGLSVYCEADTYWICVAGLDPLEYCKKYAYRMPIIHLKDMKKDCDVMDFPFNLVECGEGRVDFESILKWGEENGVEYYAIEQDYSKIGMFQSLKKSFDYFSELFAKL